jgi:peroxiredoxin
MLIGIKWTAIICLATLIACDSQKENNEFTVKGIIKNANADVVFLEEAAIGGTQPVIVDSAKLNKNGGFELSTIANEENLYVLRLAQQMNPIATVINDAKTVTVNADLSNTEQPYTVKGSKASQTLVDYVKKSNEQLSLIYGLGMRRDSLRQTGTPDSTMAPIINQHQQAANAFKTYAQQVINSSNSPALTIFTLGSYQSYASNPVLGLQPYTREELVAVVDRTAQKHPQHAGLSSIRNSLQPQTQAQAQNGQPSSDYLNKPAPDFTLPDVNGKQVSLSSFKGKYVLVDFWASWCAPCRAENPNVVKAFQQFKNKNFTILGVSLDKEKESWLKAITADGLAWTNISDLKFWDSQVVPLYGIQGIPYNVLLDPNGVVIAENLRGEELERKLGEVLK